jgi:hypothetical protein
VNGKLLVATNDRANDSKPALTRCNLDGTACAWADISSGRLANSGTTPSAVIDPVHHALLVVTSEYPGIDPRQAKLDLFIVDL